MLKAPRIVIFAALLVCQAILFGAAFAASAQTSVPAMTADDRVLGKADAPIVIFEYGSLTCPHCAAFAAGTLPKVEEAWIATGKAKLVYRDYPLDKLALMAAVVARCAPPDTYFRVIAALFGDQANWGVMQDETQALERIRNIAGLTRQQADTCVNDTKLSDFVVAERFTAEKQYGVDQTPTFFVNGQKVAGERSYPDFEKVLQSAPAKP